MPLTLLDAIGHASFVLTAVSFYVVVREEP